ncbi:hypothetical protein [Streptomyces sp. NPDC001820]|uniref:effector-associated constant component EACC1 n=1 Tax=Streptomyces sp. NPDC001820 TaxID=3364613 RepID=UPI0036B78085
MSYHPARLLPGRYPESTGCNAAGSSTDSGGVRPPAVACGGVGGALVRLVISVDGAIEEDLWSLHEWLTIDRLVRQSSAELSSAKSPPPGQQSAVVDVVSLVISSGFSAASLGVSLANWRASRPRCPAVTVERPDGMNVTISGADPEEAQRLMRQLLDSRS